MLLSSDQVNKHSDLFQDVRLTSFGFCSIVLSVIFEYLAGRSIPFANFLALLAGLLSLGLLMLAVGRLFTRKGRVGRLLCIAVYAVAMYLFAISGIASLSFARGFLAAVESRVNPDQLQQWASAELAHYEGTNATVDIPPKEQPELVRGMWGRYPPDVCVSPDKEHRCVTLVWGSGFGHWGMYVGMPDFVLAEDKGSPLLQWKPGIYIQSPKP